MIKNIHEADTRLFDADKGALAAAEHGLTRSPHFKTLETHAR